MNDRSNTIAGWVLGAGIVFLGGWLVTGEIFDSHRPETMGYPIAGVVEEGAGGAEEELPIAHYLQSADVGRGEGQFRKCAACHTVNQGGANGLGPNLWATMGATVAHVAGYNYSDALRSKGGTWDWETMSAWLASPRTFAPGTKMTYAGLSDPQDRADLMVYMNAQGGRLQLPPPPAGAGGSDGADAPGENEAQAADAPAQGDQGSPQPTEANQARPGGGEGKGQ